MSKAIIVWPQNRLNILSTFRMKFSSITLTNSIILQLAIEKNKIKRKQRMEKLFHFHFASFRFAGLFANSANTLNGIYFHLTSDLFSFYSIYVWTRYVFLFISFIHFIDVLKFFSEKLPIILYFAAIEKRIKRKWSTREKKKDCFTTKNIFPSCRSPFMMLHFVFHRTNFLLLRLSLFFSFPIILPSSFCHGILFSHAMPHI